VNAPRRQASGQEPLTADALVAGVDTLLSLPAVCARLNAVVNDPLSSNRDVAQVIGEDPGLTARLLRLANSAFYGFPGKVDTITRAVTIIGTHQLRDLAIATGVIDLFYDTGSRALHLGAFWRHSIACGVAARILSTCRREANVEYFFIAGLLHDVGRLVMITELPDIYDALLAESGAEGELLYEAERRRLGFDHAEVGAALLRQWNLPESLAIAVGSHHRPCVPDGACHIGAAIVHVADLVAHALDAGASGESFIPPLNTRAWDQLRLPVTVLPWLLTQLESQFEDAIGMILDKTP
jgi:putative nucleotidyltransferase with HDIG domain